MVNLVVELGCAWFAWVGRPLREVARQHVAMRVLSRSVEGRRQCDGVRDDGHHVRLIWRERREHRRERARWLQLWHFFGI